MTLLSQDNYTLFVWDINNWGLKSSSLLESPAGRILGSRRDCLFVGKFSVQREGSLIVIIDDIVRSLRFEKASFFINFNEAGADAMEVNRIGVAAVIIEDPGSVREVNDVLHEHSGIIIGRMGIPYRERGVNVISLVLDASADEISSLTGKLGKIKAVSVKAVMSKSRNS